MGPGGGQAVLQGAALSRIARSREAIRDVAEIWDYVSQHDERAADAFLERIDTVLAMLADQPRAGTPRDTWVPDARSFVVGRYLLLYRPIRSGIRLLRVLHGARNLDRVTRGR